MSITASEARKRLFPLIQRVNDDAMPVTITSRHGDVVLISKTEFDSLAETAYLLRSPANATRLLEALGQARTGRLDEHPLSTE